MCNERKMITLAVTGGIGSGKSLVCSFLSEKGIPVYDSDSRTKALYDSDHILVMRMAEAVGTKITGDDGMLDRRLLASVIFSDSQALARIESIVHPAVLRDFLSWADGYAVQCCGSGVSERKIPFVVMESAIILEKPLFKDAFDFTLLVDAPLETRIGRAMARDGVSRESVLARMGKQKLLNDISEGRAVPDADYVILNDGDEISLRKRTDAFYENMISGVI